MTGPMTKPSMKTETTKAERRGDWTSNSSIRVGTLGANMEEARGLQGRLLEMGFFQSAKGVLRDEGDEADIGYCEPSPRK